MKPRLLRLWRDWLSPLVFALLFTQFAATAVRVDGASMMPGLRHGETVIVPRIEGWAHVLGLGGYQRGDVVVFKPPREAAYEWTRVYRGLPLPWAYRPHLIKRVIGLPGDTVEVRRGAVYVNGRALPETQTTGYWKQFCHDTTSDLATTPPVRVPDSHYFVMGDNRSPGGSLDSRVFGPVGTQDIAGRAVLSVWPQAARVQATPGCEGGAHPEAQVTFSGPEHWNPRVLIGQEP